MIVGSRELLTITEAADVYGCTRGNMIYMVNTGRIPHERLGNILVVNRSDVEALRESKQQRTRANMWIGPVIRRA